MDPSYSTIRDRFHSSAPQRSRGEVKRIDVMTEKRWFALILFIFRFFDSSEPPLQNALMLYVFVVIPSGAVTSILNSRLKPQGGESRIGNSTRGLSMPFGDRVAPSSLTVWSRDVLSITKQILVLRGTSTLYSVVPGLNPGISVERELMHWGEESFRLLLFLLPQSLRDQ